MYKLHQDQLAKWQSMHTMKIIKFLSRHSLPAQSWLLLIPVLGFVTMLMPELFRESLFLHIESVKQGEYWRIISGHFVYVSWKHWIVNTTGVLLLLLFFYDSTQTGLWFAGFTVILLSISCGLLLFSESLRWYAGFSGVLIGLFAFSALLDISKNKIRCISILLILTVYVAYQIPSGELSSRTFLQVKSSTYAHIYGYITGIICAGLAVFFRMQQKLN